MNLFLRRCSVVCACVAWILPVQAAWSGFPEWLGGKPDVDMHKDRCGVYEWFLDEADRQTEGIASNDELASKRVINVANKLVEHHRANSAESYSAEIKFLVIGHERGPFDFELQISNAELERVMSKVCGE